MALIFHKLIDIDKAANEIYNHFIEENYMMNDYKRKIFDCLNYFFGPLRNDLKVFIEYPYVDRVFRDSYYCYFSTKHKVYSRDCIRLSFFSSEVGYDDFENVSKQQGLEEKFFGYCIIRPTFPKIIGRNLIAKEALKKNNFITCTQKENILINGVKLSVIGFPHSSQDGESITCAETTIWGLMEYFGHKYAEYKPVLPSVIINKLNERSDRRMLPSNGLTVEQISYALKDFGFGTLIYAQQDDAKDFLPDLAVYLESGIPVIAAIINKKETIVHAILIIGREKIENKKMVDAFKAKSKLIPYSSINVNYIVQDDNLTPYSIIPLSKPGINYTRGSGFLDCKITSFVIPLYKKIYMEAKAARKFMQIIFEDDRYGSETKTEKHIFRPFLASSRSFKEHIAKQESVDSNFKKLILGLSMPRFIYCGEFINQNEAINGEVTSLIVLDATEACDNWIDSFTFAAHKKKTYFSAPINVKNKIGKYQIIPIDLPLLNYKMYEKNLN